MENNLTRIKLDLQKNAVEREKLLQDMNKLSQSLLDVCEKIRPVKERLADALNSQPQDGCD